MNQKNKQKDVLIVYPSKKGTNNFKTKIKSIIEESKTFDTILEKLNPVLRGWAEHKRITPQSFKFFKYIDRYVWERIRATKVRNKAGRARSRVNYAILIKGKDGFGIRAKRREGERKFILFK